MNSSSGSAFLVMIAAVVVLVPSGCSRNADVHGQQSKHHSPGISPLDARTLAERQAIDAYRGMWDAYVKAGLAANPDEPDLAKYASGDAIKLLKTGLGDLRAAGHVIRGDLVTNPTVETKAGVVSSDSATLSIEDCLDSTNFLIYVAKTGALVNNTPGGRRATTAVVKNIEGVWKVASFAAQGVGTC